MLKLVRITERSYPGSHHNMLNRIIIEKLGFENEENGEKELPSVQARKERDRKLSPASFTQSQ